MTKIDHLVIGAVNLPSGVEYVNELLGVDIPYGGEHAKMGTHNHLMQLGGNLFLEVIAINPQADETDRRRWYALDDPSMQERISHRPALLTWVVNTEDIFSMVDGPGYDFGKPELIRRGNLSWYIGLPGDGSLFEGGTVPYIIQWNTGEHPAAGMSDQKCQLVSLDIYHPDTDRLGTILHSINARELVGLYRTMRHPHIVASIQTPLGLKQLSSLR